MQLQYRIKILSIVFLIYLLSADIFAMSAKPAAPENKPNVQKNSNQVQQIKKINIFIKNPNFKGKDTSLRVDILKVAIDEIIKTQKYELIFTHNDSWRDANVNFVELIMEGQSSKWGKNLTGYNLQFYLVNGKNGKVMVQANRDHVEDRRLVFMARSLIYELFYGKELKDSKEKDAAIKSPNKEESQGKKGDLNNEKSQEKIKNEDQIKEAAPIPEDAGMKIIPPKNAASSQRSKVEYNFTPPIKPKINPEDPEKEKKSARPEKKTAEELSVEINEGLAKVIKSIKKEIEEKKQREAKGNPAKENENASGPPEDLTPQTQKSYAAGQGDSDKAKKTFGLNFFGLIQTTESKDLVETTNNIKHVGVGVISKLQLNSKSKDSLNLDLSLTVVIDADKQFKIPGIKKLGIIYEKTFGDFFFHPHFGIEYETQSFINLAEVGAGLKVWGNKLLWYKFGGGFYFSPYSYPLYFVGELGKTFVGTTNYGTDNKARTLDGNKTHFYLGMGTPFGIGMEFHLQVAEMRSQSFTKLTNTETTGYVSMIYHFK